VLFFPLVAHLLGQNVYGHAQTHFGAAHYQLWVQLCIFWVCNRNTDVIFWSFLLHQCGSTFGSYLMKNCHLEGPKNLLLPKTRTSQHWHELGYEVWEFLFLSYNRDLECCMQIILKNSLNNSTFWILCNCKVLGRKCVRCKFVLLLDIY